MKWLNPWNTVQAFLNWRRRKRYNGQLEDVLAWWERRQRIRQALKVVERKEGKG